MGTYHTCAIAADHRLYCWGSNIYGELGAPSITYDRTTPLAIDTTHSWEQVTAGEQHTCAITTDGELYCWGTGHQGALGIGSQSWPTPQRTAR